MLYIISPGQGRSPISSSMRGDRGGLQSGSPLRLSVLSRCTSHRTGIGCDDENCPLRTLYGIRDDELDGFNENELDSDISSVSSDLSPGAPISEQDQPIVQQFEKSCAIGTSNFVKDLWGNIPQQGQNSGVENSHSAKNEEESKEKVAPSIGNKEQKGEIFRNVFRNPERKRPNYGASISENGESETESSRGSPYPYPDSPLFKLISSLMFGPSEIQDKNPQRTTRQSKAKVESSREETKKIENPKETKLPNKETQSAHKQDELMNNSSAQHRSPTGNPDDAKFKASHPHSDGAQNGDEARVNSSVHEEKKTQNVKDTNDNLSQNQSPKTTKGEDDKNKLGSRTIQGTKNSENKKTEKKEEDQKERANDINPKRSNPIIAPLFTNTSEQSSLKMFSGESSPNKQKRTVDEEWTIRDIMDEKLPAINEDGEDFGMFNILSSVAARSGKKIVDQLGRTIKVIGYGGNGSDAVNMPALFVALKDFAAANNLELKDGTPDGNCMFQSVADQLKVRAVEPDHSATSLRHQAVLYLKEHPYHDDGSPLEQFLSTETWSMYLSRMSQPSQWGDHMILKAMSNMLKRNIMVYNVKGDGEVTQHEIVPMNESGLKKETLYLGHLGEFHYMSLRPQNWEEEWLAKAKEKRKEHDIGVLHASLEEDTEATLCQFYTDLTHVDPVSGVPLPHLSYLLSYVLPPDSITVITCNVDNLQLTDTDGSVIPHEFVGSLTDGSRSILKDVSLDEGLRTYHDTKWRGTAKVIILDRNYRVFCDDGSQEGKPDIVADESNSHPGYCRLRPMTQKSDLKGKYVIDMESNETFITAPELNLRFTNNLKLMFDRRGTIEENKFKYIPGYRCENWPNLTTEWISRDRPANWPSPRLVEKLLREKCCVIQRAHPLSNETLTEWQFIFSKAEKLLFIEGLTEDQNRCYEIFRIVVDFYTRSLSCKLPSINLKSIFFYACEIIPRSYWTDLPGGCFLYLVGRLLQCIREQNLPNYFIRENNMIDHINADNLRDLQEAVESIRQFPIESITFLSERHGYHDGWLSKYIMMDIPIYVDDDRRDLNRVIQRVFVPGLLRKAMRFANKERYTEALGILNAAYEELLMTPPAPDGRQTRMPRDSTHFIKEVINNIDCDTTKHLFGSYMSKMTGVEIVSAGTDRNFMRVKDLTGGVNIGGMGDAPVPKKYRESPLLQARYLDSLAHQMYLHAKFPDSGAYLGHAVDLIDNALTNGQMDVGAIEDPYLQKEVFSQSYQSSLQLTSLLYEILLHLQLIPLPDLLTVKLTQIEDICERFPNPAVVSNLISAWKHSGFPERAAELQNKFRDVMDYSSSQYNYCDPYNQTQYI